MRLLVVNSISTGGGVTTSFLSALKMIANKGHEAIAMVPGGFQLAREVDTTAAHVVYASGLDKGGALQVPVQALQIVRAAKKHRVDRIIVNNGRFVGALKRMQNLPVICIYHGGKIDRILKADRILTINDDQYDWILERDFFAGDLAVVDNVLPVDELPLWQERSYTAPLTIGTLRLLEPAKGVDVLIDALGLLALKGLHFKILIGSNGSQKEMLRELADKNGLADDIIFTGWEKHSSDFYKRLDLYVLPSRFEEWGLGVAEAWAHSLPVIATDCLGPKRLVRDGRNGLLVARDNPQAMADGIEKLAASVELMQKLAKAGYESASLYLMKNIEDDYVSFVTGDISKFAK